MKKILMLFVLGILLVGTLNFIAAEGVSYCCEKTKTGAWCQNAPQEECDASFNAQPTSCESTSYCRMGCCYDSEEGTCDENSPQKACENSEGIWKDSANCDIAQCSLGCCLMGDQASFVTQVRCNKLSSLYGLEINFRTDISNEVSCIASAFPDIKGACVYEEEFQRKCQFITKKECQGKGGNSSFHDDTLCTDPNLDTICEKSQKTTCVTGRDEVYFKDTCGNLANIYDYNKINDDNYWSDVYTKQESCGYGANNAGDESCGNCDYYRGSTCKADDSGRAKKGDYICESLACQYKGKNYEHGETWCQNSVGADENLPGSGYNRLVCYNGEVTVEPCAEFRQEICIESKIGKFRSAACRVNMWQDCFAQDNVLDCENSDRRDCKWIDDITLNSGGQGARGDSAFQTSDADRQNTGSAFNTNSATDTTAGTTPVTGASITGRILGFGDDDDEDEEDEDGEFVGTGACVPENPPGFDFWQAGDAQSLCSMASTTCTVVYEEGLFGGKTVVAGGECLSDSWEDSMNEACQAIGDCGVKTNYIGVMGYHTESSVKVDSSEDDDEGEEDEE